MPGARARCDRARAGNNRIHHRRCLPDIAAVNIGDAGGNRHDVDVNVDAGCRCQMLRLTKQTVGNVNATACHAPKRGPGPPAQSGTRTVDLRGTRG